MSNFIDAQNTAVVAGTVSRTMLSARPNRVGVVITNTSSIAGAIVYLSLGPIASNVTGIVLEPNGGSYSQGAGEYTGVISGICPLGNTNVAIVETYYES